MEKVKTHKFGEVTCAKYTTGQSRETFTGIRAPPGQVKMMPVEEARRRPPPASIERSSKRIRTTAALVDKRVDTLVRNMGLLQERVNLQYLEIKSLGEMLKVESDIRRILDREVQNMGKVLFGKRQRQVRID